MATLTEIINGKGTKKQAKQIAKLVSVVAEARAEYGNEDKQIDAPIITGTCEGAVKFTNLTPADKLALVNRQIVCIRQEVGEVEHYLDGKISKKLLGKVINEVQAAAIATDPILVNLGEAANGGKYL